MADQTNISWCDHTHNEWIGCSKVSPACDGCYAEAMMDKRYGRVAWGGPGKGAGTRSLTSEANRRRPFAWDRAAASAGTRPFVFCSSLADVFDNQVPPEWRRGLFETIRGTPNLVWLLLTKRPQNIVRMVKEVGFMPRNIAFGTTVEDRQRVGQNLPPLIVAAGLRPLFLFISCEPLLGDLGDIRPWLIGDKYPQHLEDGERFQDGFKLGADDWPIIPAIGWVITGGETDQGGHRARPTRRQWLRSLRDQCAEYRVPFHHKQNGEWLDVSEIPGSLPPTAPLLAWASGGWTENGDAIGDAEWTARVGKKASGRLLDGVEHNGFPEVRP